MAHTIALLRATAVPEGRTGARKGVDAMAESRSRRPKASRGSLSPANILIALSVFVFGSMIGVGLFTFGYANGASYLGNDPEACINCHVMEDQYQGWQAGSHKDVATCNDCHAPHTNIVHKYLVKGENGFRHALAFTTGWHPENLRITEGNREVTEGTCLYCHEDFVEEIHVGRANDQQVSCITCHSDVGHM